MAIIDEIIVALKGITVARYHKSERGFQTEFYKILSNQLNGKGIFPEHTILEAEVQKRNLEHYGITQRPDLLIHIPIEMGITENVNENNFVNLAFKLLGNERASVEDYGKLEQMFILLNYELGVYINIGSYPEVFLSSYDGEYKDRMHEFSILLEDGNIKIKHAFFKNEDLIINEV